MKLITNIDNLFVSHLVARDLGYITTGLRANPLQGIDALKADIRKNGLKEPIEVVAYVGPGGEIENFLIVSGERRFLACLDLGMQHVQCTIVQMICHYRID